MRASYFVIVLFALVALAGGDNRCEAQVPVVEAEEVQGALPAAPQEFVVEQTAWPKMPPLDEIPPMPMPEMLESSADWLGFTGAVLVHDALKGETTELDEGDSLPLESALGGVGGAYFPGIDGGVGSEPMTEGFGTMTRITSTGDSPYRMNTKLLMRFENDNEEDAWFTCSGSMIDAQVVLTAAHCVYSREPDIMNWAKEIYVFPGWDGNGNMWPPPGPVQTHGWARGTVYSAGGAWVNNGDVNEDIAVVQVTRAVGMLTGWYGWVYGQDCASIQSRTYHNISYPSEDCSSPGLHNGSDMYWWYGTVDACPNNMLRINTTPGCFTAAWGGMSGSSMYWNDAGNRFIHAIASTSNRTTSAHYCKIWQGFSGTISGSFIPAARGTAFDLQPLMCRAEPASIAAGSQTTVLNHLAVNATNNNPPSATYTYRVYLSTDDSITSGDTLLSTLQYTHDFGSMDSLQVNTPNVTIPIGTPPGTYWLGVLYAAATDGHPSNNTTNGWDATRITVTCPSQAIPTGVAASDGTYPTDVRLTWTAAAGAATYEVWRNTVNNSGTATRIAQSLITTSYHDSNAVPAVVYYYWVKAKNACGNTSGFSTSDVGWRALSPPLTVSASSGFYADFVRVSWSPTYGASHYRVYRSTVGDSGTASFVSSWQTHTIFNDSSATPGVTYYYWVRAATSSYGSQYSEYSLPASGWRLLSAPGGVSASDGSHWTHVRVTWDEAPEASHYRVHRHTSNLFGDSSAVSGWQTERTFDDTSGAQGQTYYYWVRAALDMDGTRPSSYGEPDTGWRNWEPPFISTAVSTKQHGGVPHHVNIFPPAIEGRTNNAMTVVVTFDKPIEALGGPDFGDVSVSAGGIAELTMTSHGLSATIEKIPDATVVLMTFPGIAVAGHPTALAPDELCFGALLGDVTGDGRVNIFDLVTVRNALNQPVTAANFRGDVNADNAINIFDLVTIRNNLNKAITGPCP